MELMPANCQIAFRLFQPWLPHSFLNPKALGMVWFAPLLTYPIVNSSTLGGFLGSRWWQVRLTDWIHPWVIALNTRVVMVVTRVFGWRRNPFCFSNLKATFSAGVKPSTFLQLGGSLATLTALMNSFGSAPISSANSVATLSS